MCRAVSLKKTAGWNVMGVTAGLLGGLLGTSSLTNAQSFTVTDGQTVTTPQIINTDSSIGRIEEGGTIISNVTDSIQVNGNDVRVENNGLVANTAPLGVAIKSTANNNFFLINNGVISANGTGVSNDQTGGEIINNGTISGILSAVSNNGDSFVLTNNGRMSSSGDATNLAFTVGSNGQNFRLNNNGTIETTNVGTAIIALGDGATIVNSGVIKSISSAGNNTATISIQNDDGSIINSGTIVSQGPSGNAIQFDVPGGVNASVSNSGSIIAALDGHAILFGGSNSNDVLNLLLGGVIQGRLDFGQGTDTFNVQEGISLDYTFEANGAPEVVNAGTNAAVITNGSRVVIVDPSSVEIGPGLGSEVAGAVLNTLEDRVSRTYGALEDGSVGSTNGITNPFGVWGTTFADVAKLPSNNGFNSSTTTVVGTVIGADVALNDTISAGVLGGFAQARFNQDGGADNRSPSGFGGIYANYGDLFSAALLGGTSNGVYSRDVLNNTVLGGIVRNEADRDGFFIAPEVTARTPKFKLGGMKVQGSARGRMIYERLDGVLDSSIAGIPLELGGTSNRTYEARFQLGVDVIENETTSVKVKTGLDVRSTSGSDDAQITSLGQTQRAQQSPRDDQAFGGFIGGTFQHSMSDNVDLFAASEVGIMSDVDFAADFSAGIKIKF